MGTSISSGGNGSNLTEWGQRAMAENEHIKFFNGQRGYVLCKVTPDRWQTDFRIVPYVDKPGANIRTKASFIVEQGTPGAIQSY